MKKLILGTAQLGLKYGITNSAVRPSIEESFEIIDYALSNGMVGLDSAQAYGESESRIGQYLAKHNKSFTLQTKLSPMVSTSNDVVKADILESFQKLNSEFIDVFMFHRFEDSKNNEAMNALLAFKKENKIGKIGCSISNPEELLQCLLNENIEFIQLPFNILDYRWLDKSVQSALEKRKDVQIQVRSIFLQGLLLSEAHKFPDFSGLNSKQIVEDLKNLVNDLNCSSRMALCYAYVLSQNWIDSIVVGVGNKKELIENLELIKSKNLTEKELELIKSKFTSVPTNFLNPTNWAKS